MSTEKTWTPKDDEVDEEEEDEDIMQYQNQKDAILFAIHVSDSMLAGDEDDDDDAMDVDDKRTRKSTSTVRAALEVAYSVLQSRIISNPNDMMGILLFGTEATKFPGETASNSGFAHCYLLMDLDIPDAEGIKNLKELLDEPEQYARIMVPTKEKWSMANVLFGANQIFTTKAANFNSRRLFIITDNDDPHAEDRALKNSAITRARDLFDLGVQIDPYYMANPNGKPFDPSKFYDDIVYRSSNDDYEVAGLITTDGKKRLKQMVQDIRSKSTAKRANFTCKLEVGPGLAIGVKGYVTIKRQEKARSHYVYTGGEKPQLVTLNTTNLAEDTAKVVDKSEIKKAYKFGGEQIVFTQDELKQIRNFGEPIIRILGFKKREFLKFDYNIKPANFIYPDEKDIIGSTRTFTALHKKLVESDKIGVAWCITRRNTSPILVAMLPSIEEIDEETGVQTQPSGFFLIQLPFADDVRQNPSHIPVRAPATLIDKMRDVVKQLHLPKGYNPERYNNPSLQWHYRILQAMALEEELPEQPVDMTLPKYKPIHKHAGAMVLAWGEVLEEISNSLPRGSATKRTKDENDGAFAPPKRSKAALGPNDEATLKTAYQNGTLSKMTVAQLKPWMNHAGLDSTGRKADLVDRIEAYFDKKG